MKRPLSAIGFSAVLCWLMGAPAAPVQTAFYSAYEEVPLEAGVPILLVFFSTGCATCWDDLFEMRHFIEKNGLTAEIIGVTSERRPDVEAFVEKYAWGRPVIVDKERKLFQRHRVGLLPCKVLLLDDRTVFQDDYYLDFWERREEMKRRLLALGSPSKKPDNRSRMSEFLPPGRRVLYIPRGPGGVHPFPGRGREPVTGDPPASTRRSSRGDPPGRIVQTIFKASLPR
ncbi:MAG TPA: redoxin domain-containing protein [Candidatus Aminicenantes bacterium]|nr:redoxin domain-containing protein [Candidatus Aminicenantes bacterium]